MLNVDILKLLTNLTNESEDDIIQAMAEIVAARNDYKVLFPTDLDQVGDINSLLNELDMCPVVVGQWAFRRQNPTYTITVSNYDEPLMFTNGTDAWNCLVNIIVEEWSQFVDEPDQPKFEEGMKQVEKGFAIGDLTTIDKALDNLGDLVDSQSYDGPPYIAVYRI